MLFLILVSHYFCDEVEQEIAKLVDERNVITYVDTIDYPQLEEGVYYDNNFDPDYLYTEKKHEEVSQLIERLRSN